MTKRKKRAAESGNLPAGTRPPVSPEESNRIGHEQALEDYKYAVGRLELEERMVKLVLREREADQQKTAPHLRISSPSSLGSNLERLRNECGWTVEALAEAVEVERRTVFRHLKGTSPRPAVMRRYAEAFSKALGRKITILDLKS
jgi:DNA-binding XRE family transcriptional regulator